MFKAIEKTKVLVERSHEMKTSAYKTMIVAIAVLLAMQGLVMAQEERPEGRGRRFAGPGRRGPQGAMMLMRIVRRLDLTDDQIEKVKTIAKDNKETAETSEKAIQQARESVHEAVVKGASEAEVRAAAASLSTAITNHAVNKAATMASIRAILTEEQLKELDELGLERKWRGYGRGEFGGRRFAGRGGRGMGCGGRCDPGAMRGYGGRGFRRREFGEYRGRGYGGRRPWWDENVDDEEEHQGEDND